MTGALALTLGLATYSHAAIYAGNGDTSFGGAVGGASLTLTDDGTTVSGSLTKGTGGFNDVLVIYVDSKTGGISSGSTALMTDSGDGLRRAVTGFDGTNRSTLSFPTGFVPDYAIAIGPASDSFAGIFSLVEGGSLNYVNSANLSPTDSTGPYTFSFTHADIGLADGQAATVGLLGSYISNTAYRSTEAIAGNVTGTVGYGNTTTGTASSFSTVPEPAALAVLGLGVAGLLRRRK